MYFGPSYSEQINGLMLQVHLLTNELQFVCLFKAGLDYPQMGIQIGL